MKLRWLVLREFDESLAAEEYRFHGKVERNVRPESRDGAVRMTMWGDGERWAVLQQEVSPGVWEDLDYVVEL